MATTVKADQVASSPIFADMSAAEIEELLEASTHVEVPAGGALFLQGDPDDAFFILLEGEIEIRVRGNLGEERALATLGSGSIIGETSLLLGGTHSASAHAAEPCSVVKFSNERFWAMAAAGSMPAHRVVRNLARVLALRLRSASAQIVEMFESKEASSVVAEDDLDRLRRIFFTEWGSDPGRGPLGPVQRLT